MIGRALQNILGIGKVTAIDDTGDLQTMQITEGASGSGIADRVIDKVKRVTEFGFSSAPPIDAEVVMIRLGGDRSGSVVIGTSHRPSRPTGLEAGDVALYDARGASLRFTAAGPVLDCGGQPLIIQNASKITLDCPDVEMTGNLTVAGTIIGLNGGSAIELGALRDAYNEHGHGGVTAGSASTGLTDHVV